MRKTELANFLATQSGCSRSKALQLTDAFLEIIGDALAEGQTVTLQGFGTWETHPTPARTVRHPHTGKPMTIAAGRRVRFRSGAGLRRRVAR